MKKKKKRAAGKLKKKVKRAAPNRKSGAKKPKKKMTGKKVSKSASSKPAKKSIIPAGASLEEIGIVTHYFSKVEAAVVKLTKGGLDLGDTIVIKGHTTEFKEKIDSMQLDHLPVTSASLGQEIGLKVKSRVREHDLVYKIIG